MNENAKPEPEMQVMSHTSWQLLSCPQKFEQETTTVLQVKKRSDTLLVVAFEQNGDMNINQPGDNYIWEESLWQFKDEWTGQYMNGNTIREQ